MSRCPWKVHWGVGQESTTQCEKEQHVIAIGRGDSIDLQHRGSHPNPASATGQTVIEWSAGDRREYTGDWPGACVRIPGCVLHNHHHGRCAT